MLESAHGLMESMERLAHGHDRVGELARVRRRLRAGDGVRLPHRGRVRHLRPARDQPRDHPRLRRHPAAAAARGRGQGTRDEPHRHADRRLRGARVRPREPGGAGPRAVRHLAVVGAQAGAAGAARDREDQARVAPRQADQGARGGGEGIRRGVRLRGRQGGHRRLPGQAHSRGSRANDPGAASDALRVAELLHEAESRRGAHRRGRVGAVRDPGLPHARQGAVGEGRPDEGRPHRRVPARPRPLLALLRRPLRHARREGAERRRTR